MRTFPGRSQRLTRSHSCRLHDRGVDLKRRPPKSRPAAPRWTYVSHREDGPQGLRRPRFSFFRFTCQTAQDRPGPLSLKESRRSPRFRDHRKLVHRISVRSFAGAPSRRSRQRAVRAVYRTPLNALSTPNPAESVSVSIFSTLAHTPPPANVFFFARGLGIIDRRAPPIRQNWRRTQATFLGRS